MDDSRPKTTPKDFFLYLAAMATLYLSAVALLVLLFEYVDILFPDALGGYRDPYSGTMRMAIASLVIMFPLYLFLTRVVNGDIRREPAKKELAVRRWLIFLTLFVAGVTLVVDLIALINTFLGGELTARFLLKALSVFVVIGGAFLYYFADLKGRWETHESQSKAIGAAAAAAVLAAVVSGFFVMGSPAAQRLLRFDAERVGHLQTLQWQIVSYWQQKERLPSSLADLEDPITGFIAPADPVSGEPYRYEAKGPRTFVLCATFARSSPGFSKEKARSLPVSPEAFSLGPDSDVWKHGAGEECFERTIDPDRFPPQKRPL